MTDVRLNELDREEFWDVARILSPGLTREGYEAMWIEFQAFKADYLTKKAMQ